MLTSKVKKTTTPVSTTELESPLMFLVKYKWTRVNRVNRSHLGSKGSGLQVRVVASCRSVIITTTPSTVFSGTASCQKWTSTSSSSSSENLRAFGFLEFVFTSSWQTLLSLFFSWLIWHTKIGSNKLRCGAYVYFRHQLLLKLLYEQKIQNETPQIQKSNRWRWWS